MQTVVAPERSDRQFEVLPEGDFVRRFALASGAVYTTLLAGMLLVMPELVHSIVLWVLSAVVMTAVAATHAAGTVMHRRSTGLASRRTRQWLSAGRT
jgi:hypothetical protein